MSYTDKQRSNVTDVKNADGFWVTSYRTVEEGLKYQNQTRAGVLWGGILNRTNDESKFCQRNTHYKGSTNLFKDFQEFAEWCQIQHGYLFKEDDGKFWCLDKDLLDYKSKSYGPENCLFIPRKINCFFRFNNDRELPPGVSLYMGGPKYLASCSDGTRSRNLGYFYDPMEAHLKWQKYKLSLIQKYLKEDILGERVLQVLSKWEERFCYDIKNGLRTGLDHAR